MVTDARTRALSAIGDVRDTAFLAGVIDRVRDEFGRLDIVCANAGIASMGPAVDLSDEM
jgi:NAD(P)-dependent dehydrogenase (short-subunit alcohol dehydrogenase family)